jgi:hypothetical protein
MCLFCRYTNLQFEEIPLFSEEKISNQINIVKNINNNKSKSIFDTFSVPRKEEKYEKNKKMKKKKEK